MSLVDQPLLAAVEIHLKNAKRAENKTEYARLLQCRAEIRRRQSQRPPGAFSLTKEEEEGSSKIYELQVPFAELQKLRRHFAVDIAADMAALLEAGDAKTPTRAIFLLRWRGTDYVKIFNFANDTPWPARFLDLYGEQLEILCSFVSPDVTRAMEVLHRYFESAHIYRDWFALPDPFNYSPLLDLI